MNEIQERNSLLIGQEGFVRKVVLRTVKLLGLPSEDIEDYFSAAYLGLVEAAGRYDRSGEIPFERYAYFRVRGAIIDFIRNHSELKGEAYKYAKALQALEGAEESTTEFVYGSRNPDKAMAKLISFAAQGAISYRLSSFESQKAIDGMIDEAGDPETKVLRDERSIKIRKLISSLPEKERFIIEGYYIREKDFLDLRGERPELSKSWMSRLHSKALKRLAKLMREKIDV